MKYPVAVELGTETTAYGVAVPDLPGCFSAGDTLDEALANAEEAVAAWLEAACEAGQAVPAPSTLEMIAANAEFAGWMIPDVRVGPEAD